MDEKDLAIKIEGIKKQYRLGTIGGGTLRGEIESWWAEKRGKEDPNSKIGSKRYGKNERFMALDGIDLTVRKGERLGIIGHNGAGKSTLLKLLSRVTAPTEGEICIDGRISSMLEVGTGFNGELTGRENIYLNGAILGMTKAEVDSKIEQIIDFSEVRQFIDTPVKRYSSGMYVKLAFAVAAHLDSEILIMDEVLAVGDMAFQQKCLNKMSDVSKEEGRTILYVSHNMNTIRQLCERCIVMDHGKIIFEGDVEEAIEIYLNSKVKYETCVNVENVERRPEFTPHDVTMKKLESIDNKNGCIYPVGGKIKMRVYYASNRNIENAYLRIVIKTTSGIPVTMMTVNQGFRIVKEEDAYVEFELDISNISPGKYFISPIIYEVNKLGWNVNLDGLHDVYCFEIVSVNGFNNNMEWQSKYWGYFYNDPIEISRIEKV